MIPAKPGDPPHAVARESKESSAPAAAGSNPPEADKTHDIHENNRDDFVDDFSRDSIDPGTSFAPRNQESDRPRTRDDEFENRQRTRDDQSDNRSIMRNDQFDDRPRTRDDQSDNRQRTRDDEFENRQRTRDDQFDNRQRTRDDQLNQDDFTRNETDPGASFAREIDRSDPFPLKSDMLKHVRESASTGYRPRPKPSNPPSPPVDSAPSVDWICTDLSGQGWRHSDRAFLERWVAERNAALSAPRSTAGFFLQYQTCAGGRCR